VIFSPLRNRQQQSQHLTRSKRFESPSVVAFGIAQRKTCTTLFANSNTRFG
jgi:hypothetical protein